MFLTYMTIGTAVMLISAVQLLVKQRFVVSHGAVPVERAALPDFILGLLADVWLWIAAVMLVVAALLWYFSISRMPLSIAIVFASLVYPLVIVGSMVFLNEPVSVYQALGCVLIMTGIWLVAAA